MLPPDREMRVIRDHLLPLVAGVSLPVYRQQQLSEDCKEAISKQGYGYLGCGACSSVWAQAGGHYVIKILTYDGLDIPLTCNPTKELWEEIVAAGKENSSQVFQMPPYDIKWCDVYNKNGFIPKYVRHFLFLDYVHPEGFFAIQRRVDVSPYARTKAREMIKFFDVHEGNYGMDNDRPVIIDWY